MHDVRFIFIIACALLVIATRARCVDNRDWKYLLIAIMATVAADFFLVLQNMHMAGVAVFCFAHMAYVCRALREKAWRLPLVAGMLLVWAAALIYGEVIVMAAVYAAFFAVNIFVSMKYLPLPRVNRLLVLAGLCLFVLCDVNVGLMNLPGYFGAPLYFRNFYALVWIFYVPSQLLLGVSAFRFATGMARPSAKE
jgi:hypothetical protein